MELLNCFGLELTSVSPSRVYHDGCGNVKEQKLDYLSTNITNVGTSRVVQPNLGDHLALICRLPVVSPLDLNRVNRRTKYITVDYCMVKAALGENAFDRIYEIEDVDIKYNTFIEVLNWAIGTNLIERFKSNCTNNWVTSEIKVRSKEPKDLFWLSRILGDTTLLNLYKSYKREYKLFVETTKRSHYNNILMNSDNVQKSIKKS